LAGAAGPAVLESDITQPAQGLETERDHSNYYIAQGSGGRAGDLSSTASTATRSGAAQQYKAIQAFSRQTDQAADHFRALLAQYEGAYSGVAQQEVSAAVDGLDTLHYLRRGSTR